MESFKLGGLENLSANQYGWPYPTQRTQSYSFGFDSEVSAFSCE